MDTPDRVRLQHMLDAAREAILFVRDRQRHELATDRMLLLSLVKEIEIVGEAANQISCAEPRSPAEDGCTPEIPWAQIVSMRNRLIHAYADVNIEVVWSTVVNDLPALVAQLEALLADNP